MIAKRTVRSGLAGAVLAFVTLARAAPPEAPPALDGFAADAAARQALVEERVRGLGSPRDFRAHLERITREPHPAGSAENARVAAYLAETMSRAGLEVEVHEYDVYLPTGPGRIDVELVDPIRQSLSLREEVLERDPFSADSRIGPAWNAYSGRGEVTAGVVYANRGRREDFQHLRSIGVVVHGKIVVCRYGGSYRGHKVKYAEEAGARGVLLYSDPADGGFRDGPEYPRGRYLSASTVQRGSVLTLPYSGDPLTPFEPALPLDHERTPDRLARSDVAFPSIPVTPLPHASAAEILGRLRGHIAPADWQGALPFVYKVGGGDELRVRLRVEQPVEPTRIRNVLGSVVGSEFPDERVILGCHYDAWTFGAVDPCCGTATLLVLAEMLGRLAREGFGPRRTIQIAHWDAEEHGIIGSTEWVEQFRDALESRAVAYVNADAAASGPRFRASSCPTLEKPIADAARAIPYPGTGASVFDLWAARHPRPDLPGFGSLGGGSDHVGFYTHALVPSCSLSFSGSSPIYHSAYDNFAWYSRFGDPTFALGPALARVQAILATRLANADVLPYDVAGYARDLEEHVSRIERRAADLDRPVELNRMRNALVALRSAARGFVAARDAALSRTPRVEELRWVNARLIGLEKAFRSDGGLPGRPWNRSLYASPDPTSGYSAWMLPGLRRAVELERGVGLDAWEERYVQVVEGLTERIREVARQLAR